MLEDWRVVGSPVKKSVRKARIAAYQEAILDAAKALFSQQGYESVKMADIAAEAGMAKGTLYNYFDSKEAVFGALAERSRESVIETIREATANVESLHKPRAFLEALFDFLDGDAPMARVYMEVTRVHMGPAADPCADEGRMAFQRELTEALRPAYEAGHLRQTIPLDTLARLFGGMAGSALEAWFADGAERSLRDSIDDIITVFENGAKSS
jgi:AcrR family transcriptional regulator